MPLLVTKCLVRKLWLNNVKIERSDIEILIFASLKIIMCMKKSISFMICALFLLAAGICSCSSDDENATPTTRLDKGVLTEWQIEIADYFVSNNCGFALKRISYKGQYYYWFYNGIFSTFYIYDSQGNPVNFEDFECDWRDWETIYVYDPNKM